MRRKNHIERPKFQGRFSGLCPSEGAKMKEREKAKRTECRNFDPSSSMGYKKESRGRVNQQRERGGSPDIGRVSKRENTWMYDEQKKTYENLSSHDSKQ